MNSKTSDDLRCGSKAALKKVKGFTLLELIIVVAIISILAGISSVLISGFIRDANCESMNNRAQQIYASVQNMLVECEIDNDTSFIDPKYVNSGTKSNPAYVYLALSLNNGELNAANTLVSDTLGSLSGTSVAFYNATTNTYTTKSYDLLNRYLADTLAADFTGYAYVCIDLESYVVDSVTYCESMDKLKDALAGSNAFCDIYQKNGVFTSGVAKELYGCKDIYHQKDEYENSGYYIGHHPYMANVSSEYTIKSDKYPHL